MLSKVAERTYWLGRYMERVESTARLLNVNTELVLDLPSVKHIWGSLIDICGAQDTYTRRFSGVDERRVMTFLLDDESNSLLSAVVAARENARTVREIIPAEAWPIINSLYLYIRRNHESALDRTYRHKFLSEVLSRCHQLVGQLADSMSNDIAYNFLRIGRNLERADMTTRILDVGCINLLNSKDPEIADHDYILWMSVLRSLSAYQMYRQKVRDRVNGHDVTDFLLNDANFPRSVAHCLRRVQGAINDIPRNDLPLRRIAHVQRVLAAEDVFELLDKGELSEFIDRLQKEISDTHDVLVDCWFDFESYLAERARSVPGKPGRAN